MKRPTSHVCAVFIFALYIILNIVMLQHGTRNIPALVIAAFCVLQLLGMFVAPGDRRQHTLGTLLLVLIAMDAAYDLALLPALQLIHHDPAVRATWATVIINAIASCAVLFLAYEYAFGKQSTAFFNRAKNKPQKK